MSGCSHRNSSRARAAPFFCAHDEGLREAPPTRATGHGQTRRPGLRDARERLGAAGAGAGPGRPAGSVQGGRRGSRRREPARRTAKAHGTPESQLRALPRCPGCPRPRRPGRRYLPWGRTAPQPASAGCRRTASPPGPRAARRRRASALCPAAGSSASRAGSVRGQGGPAPPRGPAPPSPLLHPWTRQHPRARLGASETSLTHALSETQAPTRSGCGCGGLGRYDRGLRCCPKDPPHGRSPPRAARQMRGRSKWVKVARGSGPGAPEGLPEVGGLQREPAGAPC